MLLNDLFFNCIKINEIDMSLNVLIFNAIKKLIFYNFIKKCDENINDAIINLIT